MVLFVTPHERFIDPLPRKMNNPDPKKKNHSISKV
jgi:hypothetical protein